MKYLLLLITLTFLACNVTETEQSTETIIDTIFVYSQKEYRTDSLTIITTEPCRYWISKGGDTVGNVVFVVDQDDLDKNYGMQFDVIATGDVVFDITVDSELGHFQQISVVGCPVGYGLNFNYGEWRFLNIDSLKGN